MDFNYSLEKVTSVLEDFYALTNYRIALFDASFHELVAIPSRISERCKLLREDETFHLACLACDYKNFQKVKETKQALIYQCHAGLSEMIIPLLSKDIIIGYFMCGQVNIETPEEESLLEASMRMIEILAIHLESSNCFEVDINSMAYKIDNYILTHLNDTLDVSTLCAAFHYQKTSFYKLTNGLYKTGIMKHIRHLRIQKAKHLLSTTTLNISEISECVGIDDYNYFTKIFKAEELCTPSEYRKNNINHQLLI